MGINSRKVTRLVLK